VRTSRPHRRRAGVLAQTIPYRAEWAVLALGSFISTPGRMQHYFRTTRWLVAAATLKVGTNCRVRRMSRSDAQSLAEEVRKRNVFARHAGLRSFYCQRAAALEGVTVVEIYSGGTSTIDVFEKQAIIAENVVAASLVLSGSRREFVSRAVGDRRAYLDLHLVQRDSNLYVSSTSKMREADHFP